LWWLPRARSFAPLRISAADSCSASASLHACQAPQATRPSCGGFLVPDPSLRSGFRRQTPVRRPPHFTPARRFKLRAHLVAECVAPLDPDTCVGFLAAKPQGRQKVIIARR
jgi:hypothetical protein